LIARLEAEALRNGLWWDYHDLLGLGLDSLISVLVWDVVEEFTSLDTDQTCFEF
jgi:hypothetical protein